MSEAHLQYGYTLKEIAEYMGCIILPWAERLKKLRGKMKSDITRPDPITFIEATQSVRDELGKEVWGEEVYNEIKEIGKN